MTTGGIVWAVIGAASVAWLLVSWLVPSLPSAGRLGHALVGSWAGRAIALGAWAEIGWHLFGQRP